MFHCGNPRDSPAKESSNDHRRVRPNKIEVGTEQWLASLAPSELKSPIQLGYHGFHASSAGALGPRFDGFAQLAQAFGPDERNRAVLSAVCTSRSVTVGTATNHPNISPIGKNAPCRLRSLLFSW